MSITRLWCATIYVFDKTGTKTLMMNHKKLGKWLPPGGKIDPNEMPDVAAIRETLEETGIKVQLIGQTPEVLGGLIRPSDMQLNIVKPGQLEHIDLIYIAIPQDNQNIKLNEKEASEVKWLDINYVDNPEFNTFDSVRYFVKKFACLIKNS